MASRITQLPWVTLWGNAMGFHLKTAVKPPELGLKTLAHHQSSMLCPFPSKIITEVFFKVVLSSGGRARRQ